MAIQNSQRDSCDVFISHRSVDNAWAESLGEWLQLNSVSVWIDNLGIEPGQSIVGAINHGLEISRHVVLVMTPDYFAVGADWTTAEWEVALFSDPAGRASRVIPLLVKNCPYVPPLLKHLDWIDFRDEHNLDKARRDLLQFLQGRPPRFVTWKDGQQITSGGQIAKETLLAERASVNGKPDDVEEYLASNLLPASRLPQSVWTVPIAGKLRKETKRGISYPPKKKLIAIVREWQLEQKAAKIFTPVFTRQEDCIWTLNDPGRPEFPLSTIVDPGSASRKNVPDLIQQVDTRNRVSELLMMCVSRHLYRLGMVKDPTVRGSGERYFFPSLDGKDVSQKWKLKTSANRTITGRHKYADDPAYYHHDALFVQIFFLGPKLFLRLTPTIVFSDDGTVNTIWTGARVGPVAMAFKGREKNLDVFRDIRFWIYLLAQGRSQIRIPAGDQAIHFDTQPATIRIHGGIADDQSSIEELLERLPASYDERQLEAQENLGASEESDGDL